MVPRGMRRKLALVITQSWCRPETGYVKLILETDGQEDSSFQRSIVQSRGSEAYASHYAIDGRTVSWAAYEDKLKTFGILVKARNFLVFQVRHLPEVMLIAADVIHSAAAVFRSAFPALELCNLPSFV